MISPLAYVDPAAQIGQNVEIGPFVYIEGDVRIGDDCVIMPHVSILNGATIGARNVIHQNTVICAEPQSFHFEKGQQPHVVIGDDNVIRENVLITGSNRTEDATRIGNHNHLMNKVHIAHDTQIGNHCVLGISASIAGVCVIDATRFFRLPPLCNEACASVNLPSCKVAAASSATSFPMASSAETPPLTMASTPKCFPRFVPKQMNASCATSPTPSG